MARLLSVLTAGGTTTTATRMTRPTRTLLLLLAASAASFFFLLYLFKSTASSSGPNMAPVEAAAAAGNSHGQRRHRLSSSDGDPDDPDFDPDAADPDRDQLLIYNRIPKTASTTFMHIPYELCRENGFHVLLINNSRPQHFLSFQDTLSFARNITRWRDKMPAIYHGHFAYIEFDRLGISHPRPIYINIVRRPLERLVSYYYFLRYGDDYRINKVRSRMGDKVSFDECVDARMADCDPKKLWLQIPWFCGNFKKCWEPGNRWALEQAKSNLANKYFLVGLTDELESFIELLEFTLPRFFSGASEMFRESEQFRHIRKTKHKEIPSEKTIQIMRESKIWKMENDFYEFAASHFAWLKAELAAQGGKKATNFHYEKIRPRE